MTTLISRNETANIVVFKYQTTDIDRFTGCCRGYPSVVPFYEVFLKDDRPQRKLVMDAFVNTDTNTITCRTYEYNYASLTGVVSSIREDHTVVFEKIVYMKAENRWLLSEVRTDDVYVMKIDDETWTYDGQYINIEMVFVNNKLNKIVRNYNTSGGIDYETEYV